MEISHALDLSTSPIYLPSPLPFYHSALFLVAMIVIMSKIN